jgi:hypothetical protein
LSDREEIKRSPHCLSSIASTTRISTAPSSGWVFRLLTSPKHLEIKTGASVIIVPSRIVNPQNMAACVRRPFWPFTSAVASVRYDSHYPSSMLTSADHWPDQSRQTGKRPEHPQPRSYLSYRAYRSATRRNKCHPSSARVSESDQANDDWRGCEVGGRPQAEQEDGC